MKLPQGFQAAGVKAGIKPSGRLDLGLICSSAPLAWAMTGTTNLLKAPCVTRNRARLERGEEVYGLVVNSGNANCATGEAGVRDDERFAELAASALGLGSSGMLTASTGVVGQKLPVGKLEAVMPHLTETLSDDLDAFAQAILTTDLVPKLAEATLPGGVRVVGVAKGSGMIHPDMATMLAFVTTDANVPQDTLRTMWLEIVSRSFNQITVDGDTSPNDMAFVFASGVYEVEKEALRAGLEQVSVSLAKQIARDGEGATKLLTVRITGARNDAEARLAARAVARSPLVKSAVHGNDPNWGRILTTIGYSGAEADIGRVRIALQGAVVYDGQPQAFDKAEVSQAMNREEVLLEADLAVGQGSGEAWGCDLSAEYVRINAEYTT